MAVDLKQTYRRLLEEAFSKGNVELFDQTCDPTYVSHETMNTELDLAAAKANCLAYRQIFPDLTATVRGVYADGDTVVLHWNMTGTHRQECMGIPASGNLCTSEGISIGRFRNGKLIEAWVQWDAVNLMKQMQAGAAAQARQGGDRAAAAPPM